MNSTVESLRELKQTFDYFDQNKDGKITLKELETALRNLGHKPTKLELRVIMDEADADKSGALTFDEFAAYLTSKSPKGRHSLDEFKNTFDLFDEDGDGFITRAEMISITRKLNLGAEFPEKLINQIFSEADVDNDGKITFNEYMEALYK